MESQQWPHTCAHMQTQRPSEPRESGINDPAKEKAKARGLGVGGSGKMLWVDAARWFLLFFFLLLPCYSLKGLVISHRVTERRPKPLTQRKP